MHRAVTAIYRNHEVANLVRDEIAGLGIERQHIDIIPDRNDQLEADQTRDDSVLDELHDLQLPEEDARTYQQAVRRGDYVVSANVDDDHLDRVMEIMRRPEEMYDIDETEREFASSDYVPPQGYGATSDDTLTGSGQTGDMLTEGEEAIPVVEEQLSIGKRDVEKGSVHIRSYVHEVPVEERIRLRHERVTVRREAGDGRVLTDAEAEAAFQDRSVDVTETDEEAVVSKEAVVTEEITVSKDVEVEEAVVSDTVRKTEVEVDDERRS